MPFRNPSRYLYTAALVMVAAVTLFAIVGIAKAHQPGELATTGALIAAIASVATPIINGLMDRIHSLNTSEEIARTRHDLKNNLNAVSLNAQVTAQTVDKIEKHAEVAAENARVAAEKIEQVEHNTNGKLDERIRRMAQDVCTESRDQIFAALPPMIDAAVQNAMKAHGCTAKREEKPRVQT